MSQQSPAAEGPPYASTTAGLGGLPTIIPDVPICAVFIALFACSAAANMTILQRNRRRGHKFALSGVMFGFSMARITTLVLRVAWAAVRPASVRLALAAGIFVNAGVLLLYVVDLLFALRVLRARRPRLGWHPLLRAACVAAYAAVVAALVMVIVAVVLAAYTTSDHVHRVCRALQLAASTFFLVFAAAPLAVLAAATFLPRRAAEGGGDEEEEEEQEETFGTRGSMRAKTLIVALTGVLCVVISGFKTGVAWTAPRPAADPAWYHSKPAFYIFVFTLEILTVAFLTALRVDQRFWIPDGSKGPGDYSAGKSRISNNGDGSFSKKEDANGRC
ncbi:hypothetical protein SLS62_011186 [Diatrype stigma]|uniref:Uncharacterized protein n=1 Tax=Diatrype stigma TaxID=117547 RepID=A0AAN9U5N9_9PEZI